MITIRSCKIHIKLFLINLVFVIVFVPFDIFALYTLGKVKVGGPLYQRIVQDKELQADLQPPPLYLLESYKLVLQLQNETDREQIEDGAGRLKQLESEFQERLAFWAKTLDEGQLKQTLAGLVKNPAIRFFQICDPEFFQHGMTERTQRMNKTT